MNDVKVLIEGLNLSRLINKIIEKEICVTNLKLKNNRLTFCVDKKDFVVLEKICKNENKFIEVLSKVGIVNSFKKLRYCFGAVLAVLISIVYLFSFNNIVVDLNVNNGGEVIYDLSKVRDLLASNGVVSGKTLTLSEKEIEQLLMVGLDDIYGCSVLKKGSSLNVFVYPEIKNNETNKEAISRFDAVITQLEIYSGNTKFKVGDVVKKGDVLISDDTQASGKIRGKVYFSSYEIFCEKRKNVTYTGNFYVNREVSLFAKNLYKQSNNNKYSHYLTKKCVFYINNNLFLPLICNEEFVFEIEIKEEFVEFEKYEEEIKNRLLSEISQKNDIDYDDAVVSYSVVRDGDYVRVDCFVEVELDLC